MKSCTNRIWFENLVCGRKAGLFFYGSTEFYLFLFKQKKRSKSETDLRPDVKSAHPLSLKFKVSHIL